MFWFTDVFFFKKKRSELTGFSYDFTQRGIPVLQHYLEEKVSNCCLPELFISGLLTFFKQYGDQYARYESAVPYKFVPYVW